MGRPPLYVLCVRGYETKFDYKLQKKTGFRKKIISKLIPPLDQQIDGKEDDYAHWNFICP